MAGLGLFVVVVLAYWPALSGAFVWNDADYVTAIHLRTLRGLWRIWFEVGATEQYYPLLHTAFWIEHRLWGDAPLGYHLASVLQHGANACLFTLLLRRLAGPGAWLAGYVFALHPVGVESVAWIAEQKNTLSTLLYLLAAHAWLNFDEHRRHRDYAAAFVLFVCALLAKTVTATLPAALLVVTWWRRGRVEWRRDVAPLLPWLIVGALGGIFSAWVEREFIGAEGEAFALNLTQRLLLSGRVVWFYFGKLFWPADLVFIYPRWQVDASVGWQWLFSVALAGLFAGLWMLRRRARAPLAAVLLFVGTLFPVLGFFNVYGFLFSYVADHWQYLPSLAVFALAASGFVRVTASIPKTVRHFASIGLMVTLGVLTARQSGIYADAETLYRETIARNPDCWMAHNNLGGLLREKGRIEEAIAHFTETLRLKPDSAKAHNNLGNALRDQRRHLEAVPHFESAIALAPGTAEYHDNLAAALRDTGRPREALTHHGEALRLDRLRHASHNNYGVTLRALSRLPEAIEQFQAALQLEPRSAPAHLNLALTHAQMGNAREAETHYREARRLNPKLPDLRPASTDSP